MKRGKLWSGTGALALLVATLPASGADLLSVYDQALVNDPIIREAEANRRAQREARPQAIANLLPGASASAGKSRSWSDGTGFQEFTFAGDPLPTRSDTSGNSISTSKTWGLQLRQSLFSWGDWIALRTANSQVAQAESDYLAQLQGLAQRVGQQYFAVLQSRDTVEAQEAARDAISRQLEQSERRFEVGLIAITDVQEARAERDNAAAQVIAAKRALASAEEQLRATIGEKPVSLNEPSEDMPLLSPDPASEEDWVRVSMEQNATLISSRISADIARDSVRSSYGGYLPSVELVAGRNYSDSDGRRIATNGQVTTSGSETYGKSLALQFSVNLNGLGYGTYSRTKQSEYLWIAAKERLERTSRNTEREARDAYLGVNSEIARVQALKQALESSRTALAATEAGYEVGTRTAVDVLTSRRLLIQAETNYSAAKYSYLNNLIQLRMAAGDLDRSTLEEINRWLTVPQPTTP
ncbi:MAG: TolC family outer membrane protein [Steroidobacteraceae bacterium]